MVQPVKSFYFKFQLNCDGHMQPNFYIHAGANPASGWPCTYGDY